MPLLKVPGFVGPQIAIGIALLLLVAGEAAAADNRDGSRQSSLDGLGVISPSAIHLSWHLLNTTQAPSPRNWFGFAYDVADKYAVLYGGYDPLAGPTAYSDTWTFSAGKWTNLHLSVHPSGLSGLVMAYDPDLRGVLAFGGEALFGSAYYNDTWLFHAGNWTQLTPSVSPPPRSQYAMAYDAYDSEMVLFGGYNSGGVTLSDTWTFNGTTWSQVHSPRSPPGSQFASMVFDSQTNQTLLRGGVNSSSGAVAGTWAFQAGTWKLLPRTSTPLRVHAPMATLANGTPVFFSGQNSKSGATYNTTYEFFAGYWHLVHTSNTPSPRPLGGIAYDPQEKGTVYFGGGEYTIGIYNATYVLR